MPGSTHPPRGFDTPNDLEDKMTHDLLSEDILDGLRQICREEEASREAAPRASRGWEEDPRIGTPIYAIIPEFIDPRSDELDRYPLDLYGGETQCIYGSHAAGEFTPHREWPVEHDYAREDGQDRELTERLVREVRARIGGLSVAARFAVPCPYCQRPLLERGPHGPPLREAVPIWAGGLMGWVHRSCHGR